MLYIKLASRTFLPTIYMHPKLLIHPHYIILLTIVIITTTQLFHSTKQAKLSTTKLLTPSSIKKELSETRDLLYTKSTASIFLIIIRTQLPIRN